MDEEGDLSEPRQRINIIDIMQTGKKSGDFKNVIELWQSVNIEFWELGYWGEYEKAGKLALDSVKQLNNFALEGQILNEIGWALMERKYFTKARDYFQGSFCKFQSIDDADGQCQSLRYLGVLCHRQWRFGSALKYYRQAINLLATKGKEAHPHEQIKWAGHEAELHNIMGNLYFKLWDFRTSYRELNLSLNQYRVLGEQFRYYQPGPLLNLGRWHFFQGDYNRAMDYYKECRKLSKELHRPDMEAGALLRMAELAEAKGNKKEALRLAQESHQVSGTEISLVRDRAAQFKERVEGQEKRSVLILKAVCQFRDISLAGIDLITHAPLTALRALQHYLNKKLGLKRS